MKVRILSAFVFIVLCSSLSVAQWVNQGAWPDDFEGQAHGIAVDPDGKVWVANFNPENFVPSGSSDTISVRLIRVFNPDGSHAPFSPIWKIEGAGINDTLTGSNSRGLRPDNDGHILYVDGGQRMYRINYQSGAGMNKVELGLGTSPVAPAVSSTGQIFVGPVVMANNSILEFDSDFNPIGVAVGPFTETGFSRTMECSADGNTLYWPIFDADVIVIYTRPDELSEFDSVGVIQGPAAESIVWNDVTGDLWFSGGSYNDMPDSTSIYTPNTWYGYDVVAGTVTDSLKWAFTVPGDPGERPRGIDFSPDGNIAYVGCFGFTGYPLLQKVTKVTSVDDQGQVVVNGYKLSQNYPNPFNPSTKISFELPASGFVSLKVYDMLGREVAELVSSEMTSGSHSVSFNATDFASGTYIYRLTANGNVLTNKMLLLK
ncbi:MAG: T9SS type A sorting domain-containing protein [Ignavibacteriaceae bacterium]